MPHQTAPRIGALGRSLSGEVDPLLQIGDGKESSDGGGCAKAAGYAGLILAIEVISTAILRALTSGDYQALLHRQALRIIR